MRYKLAVTLVTQGHFVVQTRSQGLSSSCPKERRRRREEERPWERGCLPSSLSLLSCCLNSLLLFGDGEKALFVEDNHLETNSTRRRTFASGSGRRDCLSEPLFRQVFYNALCDTLYDINCCVTTKILTANVTRRIEVQPSQNPYLKIIFLNDLNLGLLSIHVTFWEG